jgi:integrase
MAKLKMLLADETLPSARLDRIDEAMIEAYRQKRTRTKSRRNQLWSAGSVNRELATLRRLLRTAHEWKVIARVPRVRVLRSERQREFVLTPAQEAAYLSVRRAPLGDIAVVLLDTGLRLGELLSLEWSQVRLKPVQDAQFRHLTVLSAKSKNGKTRNVPLCERARPGPQEVRSARKRAGALQAQWCELV